jgi:hypothetical protein
MTKASLPTRLFGLAEYDTATVLFTGRTINELMRRNDPILAQIRRHEVEDIPNSQVTTASGEVVETAPILCQMEFSMTMSEAISGNLESFTESLFSAAESGLQSLMPQIFAAVGQVCEATGNVIDAAGQPFTHDIFCRMLETLEVDFDEQGNHNLTMVVHPDVMEKIRRLPPPTEEQTKAFDEIMERKRREFNGRKRQRHLARPGREMK